MFCLFIILLAFNEEIEKRLRIDVMSVKILEIIMYTVGYNPIQFAVPVG